MAKPTFESVDDYLAAQPPSARATLQRARAAIRAGVPAAAEVISYQIIAYCLPAGAVLYLGGWKQHYSLYPATPGVVATFAAALAAYEVEKATIRFPLDEPVPAALITRIARLRADETLAKAAAKPKHSAKTKPSATAKPRAKPTAKPRAKTRAAATSKSRPAP